MKETAFRASSGFSLFSPISSGAHFGASHVSSREVDKHRVADTRHITPPGRVSPLAALIVAPPPPPTNGPGYVSPFPREVFLLDEISSKK